MNLVAPYMLRQEADRWSLVPSPLFAGFATTMFATGCAFLTYLSSIFLRGTGADSAPLWIGAAILLVAAYSAGLAIWMWRARSTRLSIERSGRVSHGNRELCAPGTVCAVVIAAARAGDAGEYEIGLETSDGKLVYLPPPYFSAAAAYRAQLRPLAERLAELLRVKVKDVG